MKMSNMESLFRKIKDKSDEPDSKVCKIDLKQKCGESKMIFR